MAKELKANDVDTGTLIVDFSATWCPPCQALAPKFDKFAEEHGENVTIAKVDIDEQKELAQRFNVRSIPAILVIKDGEEIERLQGNVEYSELEDLLKLV